MKKVMNMIIKEKSEDVSANKWYENPQDYGVLMRFEDAVKVLCTETGSLNKRLYSAYYGCGIIHLYSDNFKDEFMRNNLRNIEVLVSKGLASIVGFQLENNCKYTLRQLNLHWKQSTKMANYIFQVYEYLMSLRMSKG